MSDYYDMTDATREQEHMAREHATTTDREARKFDLAMLVLTACMVAGLWWVLV